MPAMDAAANSASPTRPKNAVSVKAMIFSISRNENMGNVILNNDL